MTQEETIDVFLKTTALASERECEECFWWSPKHEIFVRCNDFFWWASADMEQVTTDNFQELEKAFGDIAAATTEEHGALLYASDAPLLFASRVRGMRPQNAMYKGIHPDFIPLYDACGPEREADFGNPYTRERAMRENKMANKAAN